MKQTDNRQQWKKIKNPTLMVSGKNDRLMPPERGRELRDLMKKCCWVETEGGHYDTLRQENWRILDEFC